MNIKKRGMIILLLCQFVCSFDIAANAIMSSETRELFSKWNLENFLYQLRSFLTPGTSSSQNNSLSNTVAKSAALALAGGLVLAHQTSNTQKITPGSQTITPGSQDLGTNPSAPVASTPVTSVPVASVTSLANQGGQLHVANQGSQGFQRPAHVNWLQHAAARTLASTASDGFKNLRDRVRSLFSSVKFSPSVKIPVAASRTAQSISGPRTAQSISEQGKQPIEFKPVQSKEPVKIIPATTKIPAMKNPAQGISGQVASLAHGEMFKPITATQAASKITEAPRIIQSGLFPDRSTVNQRGLVHPVLGIKNPLVARAPNPITPKRIAIDTILNSPQKIEGSVANLPRRTTVEVKMAEAAVKIQRVVAEPLKTVTQIKGSVAKFRAPGFNAQGVQKAQVAGTQLAKSVGNVGRVGRVLQASLRAFGETGTRFMIQAVSEVASLGLQAGAQRISGLAAARNAVGSAHPMPTASRNMATAARSVSAATNPAAKLTSTFAQAGRQGVVRTVAQSSRSLATRGGAATRSAGIVGSLIALGLGAWFGNE